MALQTSGAISLTNIATEFGGSAPHSLSEYYSAASGIPSSGAISIGNFHGATNALYTVATGGTVTTSGNYKIHKFTGSGTFSVSALGNAAGGTSSVEYLVIAGGAPGGCYQGGAGGGAGGMRTSYQLQGQGCAAAANAAISVTNYAVTIGAGGVFGSTYCPHPAFWYPGGNSSALGITSTGGGGGGGEVWAHRENGGNGGSGGGAYGTGGLGASCQGGNGQGGNWNGGGGGAGGNASGTSGGAGRTSSITGATVTYSRGGNGTGSTAGSANTGNGGSGTKGNGGSGIVVIRYQYQ